MKYKWITGTAIIGLTTLSIGMGAVPRTSHITDDTAIYQKLSEIKVAREARPNFDGDIARLNSLEPRYRENLPSLARDPRLAGPMKRVATQRYRYPSPRKTVAQD